MGLVSRNVNRAECSELGAVGVARWIVYSKAGWDVERVEKHRRRKHANDPVHVTLFFNFIVAKNVWTGWKSQA